ncbi:MAG: transporter substrate-binding domain-containing protein [Ruminococcaceae bacterium]|nr:transporter substrate-binding domain-containing protein [Oscillospiraceae bacterium]
MKKFIALALALVMSLALVACTASTPGSESASQPEVQATDLETIKNKGEMIIGYTVYEPMNYTDENGVFTGFDTELAEAVCAKLGVTPKFQEIVWETKEVELNASTIDCVWNGMTINEERLANMEITDPYVVNAQVVVMLKDAAYENTASLIGKNVCAEQGSAGQTTIEDDANLAQATFVPKTVQTDCLMEVAAGTCDAAVLDITLANAMIGEGTDYANLVIVDQLAEEFYGVAFRKGSDAAAATNAIFDELIADGTMPALAEKYGLTLAE